MDQTPLQVCTPLLDEWRAEVGDDTVVEAVANARHQIANNLIKALSKPEGVRHQVFPPAA